MRGVKASQAKQALTDHVYRMNVNAHLDEFLSHYRMNPLHVLLMISTSLRHHACLA
jgi:hypothetical protein